MQNIGICVGLSNASGTFWEETPINLLVWYNQVLKSRFTELKFNNS